MLLDYLELLALPLQFLPHYVSLLVLKPEVLLLMLQEIVSLSLLLEICHALLVLLEALLDVFLETFELLISTLHLVLRITEFPLVLRLEVLPLVLSHLLPLLEVLYLLGLSLDVVAEPGVLFGFLKLLMVDLDMRKVVKCLRSMLPELLLAQHRPFVALMKPLLELRQVALGGQLYLQSLLLLGLLLPGMLLELLDISLVSDLALLFLLLHLLLVHGLDLLEVLLEQLLAMLHVLALHLTQVPPLVHNLLVIYLRFLFDDLELQLLLLSDLGKLGLLFLQQVLPMLLHVLHQLLRPLLGLEVPVEPLLLPLHLLDNADLALHRAVGDLRQAAHVVHGPRALGGEAHFVRPSLLALAHRRDT